jgi:hypothetical protein
MRLNDFYYATCALVVKYHVINHHISARSPCRPIMNCFHNLPFVSFRWWRFIYFGYGRTTNKVTITASCSMCILLSGSMIILLSNHVSNALQHHLRNGSKSYLLSKIYIEPVLDPFVVCRALRTSCITTSVLHFL